MPFAAVTQWNNVAGLQTVSPPPFTPGVQFAESRYAANGSAERHGDARTEWRYGYMEPAAFDAMRTLLGLSDTVKSAEVTLQTTRDFRTYATYNAIAVDPEPVDDFEFEGGHYLNVVWHFIKLVAVP